MSYKLVSIYRNFF